MSIIASMAFLLSAQTGPFQKGMKDAAASMSPLQKAMAGIDGGIKSMTKALVAGMAVDKMWGIAEKISDQQKYADAIGMSRERLVMYEMAAKKAGLENEQFHRSLVMMSKAIDATANGEETAAEAFNIIGVNAKSLQGLGVDQQFQAIAKGFQSVNNSGREAAAIADIFGAKAYKMKTMVEMTGEEFESVSKNMKAAGLDISDQDAHNIQRAMGAVKLLGQYSVGMAQQILAQAAPAIEKLAKEFNWLMQQSGLMQGFSLIVAALGESFAWTAGIITELAGGIKIAILGTGWALLKVAGIFSDTADAWANGFAEEIYATGRAAAAHRDAASTNIEANNATIDSEDDVIETLKDREKHEKTLADEIKKGAEEQKRYAEQMMNAADAVHDKFMSVSEKLASEWANLFEMKAAGGFEGRMDTFEAAKKDIEARMKAENTLGEKRVEDVKTAIGQIESWKIDLTPEEQFAELRTKLQDAFKAGMLGAAGPEAQSKFNQLMGLAWEQTIGEEIRKQEDEARKKAEQDADDQRRKDEQHWKSLEDRASSIKDALETPAEKYAKAFEEARQLAEEGLLNKEQFDAQTKKLRKDFDEATKPTTQRGAFTEVNFARVSTTALAMQGDRVQQKQLEVQVRTAVATEKIAKKIESGIPAVAA